MGTSVTGASSASTNALPGIGSGIDYTTIVNQIIANESQPGTVIQGKIDSANAQISAYKNYSTLVTAFETATAALRDGSGFNSTQASVSGATGTLGRSVLNATAGATATPGSYAVSVSQLAQAEKLSGATFASSTTPLALSGDLMINGRAVTIAATDTLASVRDKINAVNSGTTSSGVTATIVTDSSNAQRLVLTSANTGASGINLVDGTQGVASALGWLDASQSIKHATSAGASSDMFASSTSTISSQLGLSIAPGAKTVSIGGQSVSIDLGSDSLTSIAAKLSALTGISATVQSTTVNGATKYYLDVRNTTSFVDAGNTLEQLGIVANGRSAVAQQISSSVVTAGDASTPASASTLLTNLWNGGSASAAAPGDTLNITGKRGDGTAVSFTFTIGSGSTLGDLVTALNDPTTGFGGGARAATASIDASGHIVVSDGTSGQSQLSLNIVANNQGGGRLDLGAFTTATAGRARQLVAGADASFSVDGVSFTRPSNSVSDVITGTTLSLTAADPSATAVVSIDRSTTAATAAVQAYVDAYNKIVDFIQGQQTAGASGAPNPALYNDTILRQARSALATAMLTPVAGAAADMSTPGMAGISLTKDGHVTLDATKFQTAYTTRFDDVMKVFAEGGTATNPALVYTSSTSATAGGTYAVNITQAASEATVLGTGFSGVYTDDATPDVMTISDPSSNASVQVQLANGMTTAQIVDAMNAAFGTATQHTMQTSNVLQDASAAPASSSTLVTDLHLPDGTAAGAAVGDTISFSGVRPDGLSLLGNFTVASGSTVSDLVSSIQSAVGSDATVSFTNGQISVQATAAGASPMLFSISSNNQGGGSLSFGATQVTTQGHGSLSYTASNVGGQIQINGSVYGSAAGLTISYAGGGSDSTAQLGIAAGTVNGVDVAGTIGGFAATGSGRQLVGAAGTAVDGLGIAYNSSVAGAAGSVTVTEGLGAVTDRLAKAWSDTGGTIDAKTAQLATSITTQQSRLDDFNARIAIRKAALLKEYLAMDTAVQKLQAQGNAFLAAFGGSSSSSGSSGSSSSATPGQ